MPTQYDTSDFVDRDLEEARQGGAGAGSGAAARTPLRDDAERKAADARQRLAELRREQEEIERQRVHKEEICRRHNELHTGRDEMVQNLTRGIGLLEKAEFDARAEAEKMARTLVEFRAALEKIQAINEDSWTTENLNIELSKAQTMVENGRNEWNAARLQFPLLSGAEAEGEAAAADAPATPGWAQMSFWQQCKLGLALTWPVALVGLVIVALMLRR